LVITITGSRCTLSKPQIEVKTMKRLILSSNMRMFRLPTIVVDENSRPNKKVANIAYSSNVQI
jgi:hypothetical protein